MTFFLNDQPGAVEMKARGTDTPLPGFWGGVSAAFQKEQLESNANFRMWREDVSESDDAAVEAANHMGRDRIKVMVDDYNARARAQNLPEKPMPDDLSELPMIFGPNFSRALLDEARKDPAWNGPDVSSEAVEKRITDRLRKEHDDLTATLNATKGSGVIQGIVGGIGGAIADLRNLPFLIGGGGGSLARVMGREALLNAAAESVTLPDRFAMAKRLNIPEPDVAQVLAIAAAGGAILGGAVEGAARGLTYWRGTRGADRLQSDVPAFEREMNIDIAEDALATSRRPFETVKADTSRVVSNPVLDDFADAAPLSGLRQRGDLGERVSLPFDDWVRGPVASSDVRLPRSLIPSPPEPRGSIADLPTFKAEVPGRELDPAAFQQADELSSRIDSYRGFIRDLTSKYDEDLAGSIAAAEAKVSSLHGNLKSTAGKNAKAKIRQELGRVEGDLHEMRGLIGRANESADIVRTRAALVEAETNLRDLAPRIAEARARAAPEGAPDFPQRGTVAPASPSASMPSYDEAVYAYEQARRSASRAGRELDEALFRMPDVPRWSDVPSEKKAMLDQKSADLRDAAAKADGEKQRIANRSMERADGSPDGSSPSAPLPGKNSGAARDIPEDPTSARGASTVDLNDGKGPRSIASILDELDADDDFAAIVSLCGKGKA